MLQDKKTSIKKTGLLVACFWSLVLFLSLYANILQEYKGAEKQATLVARANLDRDKAVRQWVSDRGGVYAKISELTQPSPYLAHIPTRDIQTPVGDMTLLNPVYMLRLMMDEHELLYGIKGRIVGLKALRPENIADDWERNALSQFEANRELKDYTEFDVINGESYMRMMVPLYMTPDCMNCHSILGYQVADLRGGVNVSVPLSDYYALARLDSIRLGYAHGGIWLLGLFGIGFVTKRSVKAEEVRNRDIQEIKETEKALSESELWMKSIYSSLDEAVLVVSPGREIVNVNNAAEEMFGYSVEEISNSSTELFHVDHQHFVEFGERINLAFSKSHTAKFEFESKRKSGEIFPTEHTVSLLKNPNGEVKGIVSVVRDISERKLTEQSLMKSEARLNEAQRLAKVGVWELDLLTNELVWSDEIFRIFEIDKNKFHASYEEFLNAIHPEDRGMVNKAYTGSLIDKEPYEITHRLQMNDGRIKQVHEKCKSYFDRDGKAVRSVGTVHEITERKKTEDELARVQGMLEQANRVAKMGAWSFDLISNELIWSDITKEIHEVEKDYKPDVETALNYYKEGVHRDTISRIVMDAMQNEGLWDEELIIVTAKGNEKWVRAMGQPEFKDGACVRLFGSFQDISERRRAENALVESEARYRRAEEGTNDGLWEWNVVTGDDYFSPRWLALLGYKPGDLAYHVDTFIDLIHPDDLPAVKVALANHLQNDELYDVEMRMRQKSGDYLWMNARGQAERTVQDDPTIMSGFITDITERKRDEVELQKYRHELEGLVQERTVELQQSLAEKEVLLKEVHHRVKNNMAMVSSFIQLQMNGADDVYSLGALGACESRIQAMSMVHKRLYQSNDFTSIDMKILFDEISGALFKESDFDYIELDIQANDISLEMDAAIPCAMIINELLSNSLKYAFKDGQSGKISICMDVIKGGMYCLCVCDTGVGLSEDIFMGEAETLGLQLVNVFVDQLGGELEVHRKDGVAFKVIFPAGKTTNV